MLRGLVDHLWQCALVWSLLALLARMARGNPAVVRLWLWRVAVAKLALPFAALFALGEWLGFPVTHSTETAPAALVFTGNALGSVLAPTQTLEWPASAVIACGLLLLAALAVCLRPILRRLSVESARATQEHRLAEETGVDSTPGLGFFKSLLLTTGGLLAVTVPVFSGAASDRQSRYELMLLDAESLRDAPIDISEASPGMGWKSRVIASPDGVLIRNATVQELVGLVYGVSHFRVLSDQMATEDNERDFWMTSDRYDVRILGRVRDPKKFDPYTLRRPMTFALVRRFGFEVYLDGRCQPPCGRFDPLLAGRQRTR